jgi:thioredoxin-related protein
MNRKLTYRIVAGLIMLSSVATAVIVYKRIQHDNLVKLENVFLKSLPLFNIDSTRHILSEDKIAVAIVYFNSSCEHCQLEAEMIRNDISLFSNVKLIFISTETLKDIRNFAVKYQLGNLSNVQVLKMNADDLYNYFGSVSTPHIYIYNNERRLVKEFEGETKTSAILKYL